MFLLLPKLYCSIEKKTHEIPLLFYFTFLLLVRLNIFSLAFLHFVHHLFYYLPDFLLSFSVYILLIFEKSLYIWTSILWVFSPALLKYN